MRHEGNGDSMREKEQTRETRHWSGKSSPTSSSSQPIPSAGFLPDRGEQGPACEAVFPKSKALRLNCSMRRRWGTCRGKDPCLKQGHL